VVLLDQRAVEADQASVVELLLLFLEDVLARRLVEQLAGGDVQGHGDVLARGVAGLLDRLDHHLAGGLGAVQVGGEAALVADGGRELPLAQDLLQVVEHLGAGAQGLLEAGQAQRDDHELLEVEGVVGVGAAVDDVHQGHRQHAGVGATQVLVQRHLQLERRRPRDRHGHAQDGVGADLALVGGAVRRQHRRIDAGLVEGVAADHHRGQQLADVVDRLLHALAQVALAVAVPQLQRLVLAGRGARGHRPGGGRPRLQLDLGLDGGVAPGIEDLAGADALDDGFGGLAHGGPHICTIGVTPESAKLEAKPGA
jgi:hypothetical protein